MTSLEIVKRIKAHKGKIQVLVLFGEDIAYIYAEKQDLIRHFTQDPSTADTETGVSFRVQDSEAFIEKY